jgi:hypothetical protein
MSTEAGSSTQMPPLSEETMRNFISLLTGMSQQSNTIDTNKQKESDTKPKFEMICDRCNHRAKTLNDALVCVQCKTDFPDKLSKMEHELSEFKVFFDNNRIDPAYKKIVEHFIALIKNKNDVDTYIYFGLINLLVLSEYGLYVQRLKGNQKMCMKCFAISDYSTICDTCQCAIENDYNTDVLQFIESMENKKEKLLNSLANEIIIDYAQCGMIDLDRSKVLMDNYIVHNTGQLKELEETFKDYETKYPLVVKMDDVGNDDEKKRQHEISQNFQKAHELIPESFIPTNMLFFKCSVNGVETIALFDTGAAISTISPELVKRCKLDHLVDTRNKTTLFGVGEQRTIGKIHLAALTVKNHVIPMSFVVMKNTSYSLSEIIFGLNLMKTHSAIIDIRNNCVTFGDGSKKIQFMSASEIHKLKMK